MPPLQMARWREDGIVLTQDGGEYWHVIELSRRQGLKNQSDALSRWQHHGNEKHNVQLRSLAGRDKSGGGFHGTAKGSTGALSFQ